MPDQKITELAAAGALTGTELIETVQGGVNVQTTTQDIADLAAPSGGGHVIEDEGTPLTQRANLNFVGSGVTVTDAGGKTIVTVAGGSAPVDSVNGQTGTVVLDAGDIGNTPAGGIAATDVQAAINELDSEKQTAAQVQVIADAKVADAINNGTTTIAPSQNAVFDALALKLDKTALQRSGTAIAFDVPATYGYSAAETGNITLNSTGLIEGTRVLLIHNNTGSPTFDSNFVITNGTYVSNVNNYIWMLSVKSNVILAEIRQSSTDIIKQTLLVVDSDISTSSVSANDIPSLEMTFEASSKYMIEGFLGVGCNNTGGIKIGFVTPTSSTYRLMLFGLSTGSTAFLRAYNTADGLGANAFCTVNSAGNGAFVKINGIITTAGSSGMFKVQFATTTNPQTSTVYAENSWVRVSKIL